MVTMRLSGRVRRSAAVWLAVAVGLGVAGWVEAGELRAGVAVVSVTPPVEMKVALGGYGERMSRPAKGIHDLLWAKALVLDDGNKRFCLVTLDMLGLPPSVKELLIPKLADEGWSDETVMILPSHTHTGPDMTAMNNRNLLQIPQVGIFRQEVLDFMVDRLAEVIRNAGRKTEQVRFGVTGARTKGLTRNRRKAKTTDGELTVVRIDRADGSPFAALVQLTAHPTIMDAPDMYYSGDWPGYLQREMEALIGDGAVVMYFNGAEGDQSPVAPKGGSRYERAERYGRLVGIRAWRVYEKIKARQTGPLAFAHVKVKLPTAVAHEQYEETGGKEYGLTHELMAVLLKTCIPRSSAVHSFRLGDLLIAGVPGEMTAGLGLRIKRALKKKGIRHPVIGGLCNEWISYMLSEAEYERGGYEASVSFYGKTLGPLMVDEAIGASERLVSVVK